MVPAKPFFSKIEFGLGCPPPSPQFGKSPHFSAFFCETFPETMKLIVLKQGWCGWTTSPLLSTWPTPADGFRHRPVPILPIYDLWFRPGTPGKNCGVIKVKLNLRGSMLVSCSFIWTRCANRKSTTKSWDQTQWGSWAKSFFRYRSGIWLLKTGSPSSPFFVFFWQVFKVLPPLLGKASPRRQSALSVQCAAVQHRNRRSYKQQHFLQPRDSNRTFLRKYLK